MSNTELLNLREAKNIHIARKDGAIVGYIIPATAPDGYSGDINLITGILADGTIAGVRVLSHNETPGLGDKIDYNKSQWVDSFIGKSLLNPSINRWKVKKDKGEFDQLQYYDAHAQTLQTTPPLSLANEPEQEQEQEQQP